MPDIDTSIYTKPSGVKVTQFSLNLLQRHYTLPTGDIIDLGCGPGLELALLKELFSDRNCVGIDCDANVIAHAQQSYSHLDFRVASIERTHLPNQSVALAFSHAIMDYGGLFFQYYFGDDLANELDRIIVPGGVYYPLDFKSSVMDVVGESLLKKGFRELYVGDGHQAAFIKL